MQELVQNDQTSEHAEAVPRGLRVRLLAVVASMFIPGSGHLLLGDKRRAIKYFLAFLVLLSLYWPIRLQAHNWGLIFLVFFDVGVAIAGSCSAALVLSNRARPVSQWWFLLTIPMAAAVAYGVHMNTALRASGFRIFDVPSTSMAPTIDGGDSIVVDFRYFHHHAVKDGDVVVIRHHGLFLVKRVAAMAGETISSVDGQIVVNGSNVDEPYTQHSGHALPEANNFGPITVPAGELFVLGDNRDESLDSRFQTEDYNFGAVLTKDLVGIPLYIVNSKRTGHWVH